MKKRGEQIMEAIITVIIVLLVCIVIWYISTSNGIKRSQLKVEEAESGIDVALTKRYDVLTKMLVQYEACCISEQHRSKQHACGKETILRGRGSKASGCEDELLIKIKILKQKSGAFMQMNSPDFLWQRLSNARIMRCI